MLQLQVWFEIAAVGRVFPPDILARGIKGKKTGDTYFSMHK